MKMNQSTKKTGLLLSLLTLLIWWFSLPDPLFRSPTSTLLESKEGILLSAIIADDGQWRFPAQADTVPHKFAQSIMAFEDEYFRYHAGVNPVALGRAMWQNLRAGRVVSGGSTLNMQVLRLALSANQRHRSRSVWNKLVETLLAVRLELSYSKDEILQLYTANAPFGGNVVGLKAAAWRYYGRTPEQLSWGEMATLAVLPNAPSLIYPGRNQDLLRLKRNRLLHKLWKTDVIDSVSARLAQLEPLPQKPFPLPQTAFHLLSRAVKEGHKGEQVATTIEAGLQEQVTRKVVQHHALMSLNQIHNAAVVVFDIAANEVVAYVGNVPELAAEHSPSVDIVAAPRSTGSILKPFLFAAAQHEGLLLPRTLLADIPTKIAGYTPENFDRTFRGAVPAHQALAWSLNVPAVRLLQDYSYPAFLEKLRQLGISTMSQPADHYGLSLILGGAEANLWELTSLYAGLVRTVQYYTENSGHYAEGAFDPPAYLHVKIEQAKVPQQKQYTTLLSAGACWQTLQALTEVTRPDEEKGWQQFSSSQAISWKTGTSFGLRDAWAIGVTSRYAVGVWVGNADGEGRPGLVGTQAAAPLLFEVFRLLPAAAALPVPYDDLEQISVCAQTGHRAGMYCPQPDTMRVALAGLQTEACPYHFLIHTNASGTMQLTANCAGQAMLKAEARLVLPPLQEWYYKRYHPEYQTLPPFAPGCQAEAAPNMAIIYPHNLTQLFLPKEMDGTLGKVVFEIAHRKPDQTIFWHIDDTYIGQTANFHKMELQLPAGDHLLTLVDENGEELKRMITFLVSEK